MRAIGIRKPRAIHDIIMRDRQIRHVEHIPQGEVHRAFLGDRNRRIVHDGKVDRNRRRRGPDFDCDTVIFDQLTNLLPQVIRKQTGLRHGRRIDTGRRHMAKRQAAIGLGIAFGFNSDFGIKRAIAGFWLAFGHSARKLFTEELNGGVIQFDQAFNGLICVIKALRRQCVGRNDLVHSSTFLELFWTSACAPITGSECPVMMPDRSILKSDTSYATSSRRNGTCRWQSDDGKWRQTAWGQA